MNQAKFVRCWLAMVLLASLAIVAVNAWVDPLWLFSHANRYNQRQWGFDERLQKTHRVRFQPFDYDALLLGSSRSTYIDQHGFAGVKLFNYAASGMRPAEFAGYIDFAQRRRGQPLREIYLGLDFFATNALAPGQAEPAGHYVRMTETPLYRLESLLNYQTFANARRYVRDALAPVACDCYDRANVKTRPLRPAAERQAAIAGDVGVYRDSVYGRYRYDTALRGQLAELRNRFPEARFVVFTTPESMALFAVLLETGRFDDYARWLGEIVDVFGTVYDFLGANSVTVNPENYADGHHFYPAVGHLIARRLSGQGGVPEDFGRRVDAAALPAHLRDVRRNAQSYVCFSR